MIQVKLRDFLRDFTKYKDQAVEVLGKNGEAWLWQKNVRQSSDRLSDKKEIADKIAEEVPSCDHLAFQGEPTRPQMSESLAKMYQPLLDKNSDSVSKDSTDNAGSNSPEFEGIKTTNEFGGGAGAIFEKLQVGIAGTCDICSNPSKELWEHEEEGIERNVCFGCFMTVFKGQASNPKPYRTQLKEFLLTKKKVESVYNVGRAVEVPLKASAQFSDFNPIPKPVKKEKK